VVSLLSKIALAQIVSLNMVDIHTYLLKSWYPDTYRRIAKIDLKFDDKEVRLSEEVKDLITRVSRFEHNK
jgi:hypothetical protein